MKLTFVLNDETIVNSRGFRVRNAGIDLERFKSNPVILSDHWASTSSVIGRWENIRIEGTQLKADAVFDEEDEEAKKVAGKVKRGFLKGASMGLDPKTRDNFVMAADSVLDLVTSELMEASIVAIPSNQNSVKLYHNGSEMEVEEVEAIVLSAASGNQPTENNKTENNMKKLNAATVAILMSYGLTDGESAEQIDASVQKLKNTLDAEQAAHKLEKESRIALEAQIANEQKVKLTALIDGAVKEGQIVEAQKEVFTKLGYDQAKAIIEGLPKKVSLSGQVSDRSGAGAVEPKTLDEFVKLSLADQLAFKDANPEGYQSLFAE